MYRVILVDDETINYQLFEKLVNWKEKGFEIVGTAADGQEALQKYEELKPDLIFMDIQLPLMDGLECVRCIRQEDSEVKIVIVSAYGDFSYAQKAIRYGVQDFLLKPVSRLMLNQLTDKMKTLLDARKSSPFANQCFEREEAQRMKRCMSGQANTDEAHFTETGKKLFAMLALDQEGKFCSGEELKGKLRQVLGSLKWRQEELAVAVDERGCACILCSEEDFAGKQQILAQFEELSLRALLFPFRREEQEEQDWFARFPLRDNPCFYHCQSGVYSLKKEAFSEEELRFDNVEKVIGEAIAENSGAKVTGLLEGMFRDAKKKNVRPGILKEAVLDLLIQIKFALKKLEQKESFSLMRNLKLDEISDLQEAERLYERIFDKIDQTFLRIDSSFFGQGNRLVFRTNALAEISYMDSSFSVQAAADYNGISKNYFTGLYKEQAGIGFWEYVTKLRMEKAKELLVSTDELVGSISSMVGYESEFHFSRKFKEYTGESPNQFRKNRRNPQK